MSTENDLPLGRWVPFHEVLEALRQRQSINDGGKFVLEHWACKYIDIRLDMRIGMARLVPGSGPDSVYTKLAQAKYERDAAVETITELHDLLRCVLVSGRLTGHMLADEIRALDYPSLAPGSSQTQPNLAAPESGTGAASSVDAGDPYRPANTADARPNTDSTADPKVML